MHRTKKAAMNNKIRKLLLILGSGLIVAFGISIYYKSKVFSIPTAINLAASGVDIQIKEFNLTHEVLGNKQWQLNAKTAQVDKKNNLITLSGVAVYLSQDENHKSQIFADSGKINIETKEIELEGNVRFIADADQLFNRLKNPPSSTSSNQEPASE